jgi:SAM-dependent methyltransferase
VTPRVLHAGCGNESLPEWLPGLETRLDIDPAVSPDIVAPLTDMGDVGPFHMAYCAHALEHLPPHEIDVALKEFHRVLHPGGFLIVVVPNLTNVRPTEDVIYHSPAGPVTGLDMYYGMARLVKDNPFMAHKYGFVRDTLELFMTRAGFKVTSIQDGSYNLIAIGQT